MHPASRGGRGRWARTFTSLGEANYRRFFIGQSLSMIGTWMQAVAQSWLVLQLSRSGTVLGLVVAVQTLPVLFLAPYGGLLVDRADKRRLLLATQASFAVLALVLGALSATGTVRLWMVVVLAVALGLVNSVDNPARQAFVPEIVQPDMVANAVTLNSVMTNAARAIGPAIAGLAIVASGVSVCFFLNAVSFVAIIVALLRMDPAQLRRPAPAARKNGQVVEGLRYVARTPRLLTPLLMMALVGALSYEFQVTLPLMAQRTFHAGAGTYGFMTAAFGAGAVLGGLLVAGRRPRGLRSVIAAAFAFGVTLLAAAVAPTLALELVVLVLVGWASVAFMARGNSILQLTAVPRMRGRVMALWAVAFIGTTPIGGPIVGYIAQHTSPRWALAVGGFAALGAVVLGLYPRYRGPATGPGRQPPSDLLPPGAGPS